MSNYQAELNKASRTVQKQISETEERIADTTRQVQSEWTKALEEMSQAVMSRAKAEMQLGLKLSEDLRAAHSPSDAWLAYQEWLTAMMSGRSEDGRQFMDNCQKFVTESTKLF